MTSKKRGLGKGLNELLSATLNAPMVIAKGNKEELKEELKTIPIEKVVVSPYQPRHTILHEGLEELAESIRAQGLLQPILVRKKGEQYELVAGERRWRAAQLAGLTTIPTIIRDVQDKAAMAMALIENIQRENLNPLEEATALKRLADVFELTHLEVAEMVGRSRAAVTNMLRLLSLNEDVQKSLEQGQLEMGHARALLGLKGTLQSQLAQTIIEKSLSVRETERLVNASQEEASAVTITTASPAIDPNIRRLEDDLSDKLGAQVTIRHGRKGGAVMIRYHDLDELEGILAHFK